MNNVLPKFNSGDWWLAETCTQISVSEYDWTINAAATWEGSGCYVPTEWLGKTVTIGCSSISSNAGFYIQNSVTWEEIAVITSDTLEVTVTIPADSNAVLAFQAPETAGQISITGAYVYVEGESEPVPITSLLLNKSQVDMKTNSSTTLSCVISPSDADTYNLSWTKNNDNVELTPNELTCIVKALTEGNSLVTVTDTETNLSASCILSITKPIEQTQNAYLGGIKFANMFIGDIPIIKMFVGDVLIFYNNNIKGNLKIGYTPVEEEDETLDANAVIVTNYEELSDALYLLQAGQTIYLREGTYTGNSLWLDTTGTADAPIVIRNYPNEKPILSGFGLNLNAGLSYITFKGLTIANLNLVGTDMWEDLIIVGSGCNNITIEDNEFYNLTCEGGTNITSGIRAIYVLGNSIETPTPTSNVTIRNNYIHDCMTGWSEAVTIQGNVTDCLIINNTLDTTGNIGIDTAGNYSWTGTVGDSNNQARNIQIRQNLVKNCISEYAASAGIYNDGGRDIIIEHNIVYHCQCGIETGAEEPGATVENFYIRNNLLVDNGRSLGAGGYQATSATHQNTYLYNNTVIGGDWYTLDMNIISIYRTSNLVAKNNIFYAQRGNVLLESGNGTNLDFDFNCWYQDGLSSLPQNEGVNSIVADPMFLNNDLTLEGDYTLQEGSPCKDTGSYNANYCGTLDLRGKNRVKGIIDMGCYEK